MPETTVTPLAAAVAELAQAVGGEATPMAGVPGAFEIAVPPSRCRMVNVEALQERFKDHGLFVFESGEPAADGPQRIAAMPTRDRFAAVAAICAGDPRRGIQPRIVVACLKRIEARQPFILLAVTASEIRGRFLGTITDPRALAEEVLKLCPGLGPAPALADDLRRNRRLALSWS